MKQKMTPAVRAKLRKQFVEALREIQENQKEDTIVEEANKTAERNSENHKEAYKKKQ